MFEKLYKLSFFTNFFSLAKIIISGALPVLYIYDKSALVFWLYVLGTIFSLLSAICIFKVHKLSHTIFSVMTFISDKMLFTSVSLCILSSYTDTLLLFLHFMFFIELLLLGIKLYSYSLHIAIGSSIYSIVCMVAQNALLISFLYKTLYCSNHHISTHVLNQYDVSAIFGVIILLSITILIESITPIVRRHSPAYKNFV